MVIKVLNSKPWVAQNVKGRGHDLIWSNIPWFVWRDWGKFIYE